MPSMTRATRNTIFLSSMLACSVYALACVPGDEQNPKLAPLPPTQVELHANAVAANNNDGYEAIPRVSILARSRGVQTVAIGSRKFPMEIKIHEDHDLVNAQTMMVRDGKQLPFNESGHVYPFIGHVVGEKDSSVQLVKTKYGLEGLVLSRGKMFELKGDPGSNERSFFGEVKERDAARHEHGLHTKPRTCGTGDDDDAKAMLAGVRKREFELGSEGCREVELVLVADWTYVKDLGGRQKAESEMLRRMGEVNLIYRKQLGVTFRVKKIYVFPDRNAKDNNPEFNRVYKDPTPLDQLAAWKREFEPDAGLVHLFVSRASFGIVGMAEMNGVCHRRRGVGVSNYLGDLLASTIVVAHEIGHNFGADHDGGMEEPKIMAPAAAVAKPMFSSGSLREMNRAMLDFRCLKPVVCKTLQTQEPDSHPEMEQEPEPDTPESENKDKPLPDDDSSQSTGNSAETSIEGDSSNTHSGTGSAEDAIDESSSVDGKDAGAESRGSDDGTTGDGDGDDRSTYDDVSDDKSTHDGNLANDGSSTHDGNDDAQDERTPEDDDRGGSLERCSIQAGSSNPLRTCFALVLLVFMLRPRKRIEP